MMSRFPLTTNWKVTHKSYDFNLDLYAPEFIKMFRYGPRGWLDLESRNQTPTKPTEKSALPRIADFATDAA